MAIPAVGAPPLDQVIGSMLAALEVHLPAAPPPPLPPPDVTVVSVEERSVGLGNRRGIEERAGLPLVDLKGGRLEAEVRFQLWATGPVEVDTAILDLQRTLAQVAGDLRALGFLKMRAAATSLAEHVAALNAWRKTTTYAVLFEFQYEDADGADSLIARIRIHGDPEEEGSADRETTVVTDEMVRWDDESAPGLLVRGVTALHRLSVLSFVPGPAPTGSVTLLRTFDGAAGPPTDLPTLAAFLAAVSGPEPAELHARVAFPSLNDFLAALDPPLDNIELGDWDTDAVPDDYEIRLQTLDSGIELREPAEQLSIAYAPSPFDVPGVAYLRLLQA